MVQGWTSILEHRLPDRTPGQAQEPQPLSPLDLVGCSFFADRTHLRLKMHGQTASVGQPYCALHVVPDQLASTLLDHVGIARQIAAEDRLNGRVYLYDLMRRVAGFTVHVVEPESGFMPRLPMRGWSISTGLSSNGTTGPPPTGALFTTKRGWIISIVMSITSS
jgi:hypothetical protein